MTIKLETVPNFWGNNKEYMVEGEGIQISNRDTGLPSSSFYLSSKEVDLLITTEKLRFDYMIDVISGVPSLDGSEEDNLFLEDGDDDHKRTRSISSEQLNYCFTEEFLKKNDLFNKEIFVYLSVRD